MDSITGYIERITFQSDETGYTVAQLKERGKKELTCIVGSMPSIRPGETIHCLGIWKNHPIHGRQFEVKETKTQAPADVIGIKKYLGSGLIKGIGPHFANRIVDVFGKETLTIIDTDPDKLLEVTGLGKKRLHMILSRWKEQKSIREVMVFLQSHGVSPAFAQKIFKTYGSKSIEKVQENPYSLARDIFGISFKTADKIAETLGILKDSPQRVDAAIEFFLGELSGEGHTCYPLDLFIEKAEEVLALPKALIEERSHILHQEERVVIDDFVFEGELRSFIFSKKLFLAESGISGELKRIQKNESPLRTIDAEKAILWVQEVLNLQLADQQKQAVIQAVTKKTHIITGGPGTGKSTITKAILAITEKLTDAIILAAPTGRAAKRMSEICQRQAKTIHSLLEIDLKTFTFKRNKENPLECDLIIIDEASMIDTQLMYSLLRAIPSSARVLFIGDVNQLPSVGPGNVLKDFISSRALSVTLLNEIFRQAQGSKIITNAHKILKGVFPEISPQPHHDFFFIEKETPEEVLQEITALVANRLPKRYGFHPLQDIQVLAPMKKGIIGIENLNQTLQEFLNPQEWSLWRGGKKWSSGDKVMQLRNNYKKEIFNGDIGKILKIDQEEEVVLVQFEDREILFPFYELDELTLAYATSIHKYQGSECPCIVIPIHTTHFKLLNRNLLYTAVTRGRKLVVIVGTKKALSIAVNNNEVMQRFTSLKSCLIGMHSRL